MLYDTHAHLNMSGFDADREHVAAEAKAQHVIFNNVGTQKETSRLAVELADGVNSFAIVGLHPMHTVFDDIDDHAPKEVKFDHDFYRELAKDRRVVGIGECGLDYFRLPEGLALENVKEIQKAAFEAQIQLAIDLNKVLVIHTRATKDTVDAYEDTLELLQKYQPKKVLVHSFTGNWHLAQRFLELGASIGLNGIIIFDKTMVLKEVVEKTPLDRIVLETDAPFLAPPPHRGKRNLPQYVEYVARYIANIRKLSYDEVAKVTTENARTLFNIPV